jgi:glycerol-3-phosphate dehydrogenase
VVDRIASRPGVAAEPCRTHDLPLIGAQPRTAVARGLPARLVRRFGAEAPAVAALAEGRPELLDPIAPGVPALGVELRFAVEHELALTLEDVLDRRTRLALVPEWHEAAREAAQRLVPESMQLAG